MSTHAVLVDDPAVAVIGVLVDAQVGHEHDRVAELGAQVAQRDLHDAVGIGGAAADGVLLRRHAEEDHRLHAELDQVAHLGAQRIEGVLHHAGERLDRVRLADALTDEQRGDEIVDTDVHVGDQVTQRRSACADVAVARSACRNCRRSRVQPTSGAATPPSQVVGGRRAARPNSADCQRESTAGK